MNKAFKITTWLISSLLLIILLAIGATVMFVQPEFIKKQVSAWIHDNTDREIQIKGEMHWTFLQGLGLSVSDVSLSSPKSFGNTPFAHANNMTINLRIAPLLKKEFAINHVRFDGLNLNLLNTPSNVNNWTIQFKQKSDTPDQDGVMINLKEITLKNSKISMTNQRTNQKITLKNVNIDASNIGANRPINLALSANLQGTRPSLDGSISAHGKIQYSPKKHKVQLDNLELIGSHPNKVFRSFTIFSSGDIDLNNGAFSLPNLEINIAKEINAKGYLVGDAQNISGHLSTNTFNPKNLLSNIGNPIKTQNNNALKTMKIDSDIQVLSNTINFNKFKVILDNNKLDGRAKIDRTTNNIEMDLQGGKINLDNYRLVSAQNHLAKAATKISSKSSSSLIAPINIFGQLRFAGLSVDGIRVENVATQFRWSNNQLNLSRFSGAVFDGSTRGSIVLDFSDDFVRYQIQQTSANTDLNKMFSVLLGASPVTGRANIQVNIAGVGTDIQQIKKSLNGTAVINAHDGIVYGVDIDHQVSKVVAHMSKDVASTQDTRQSAYQKIDAELSLGKGTLKNSSLFIELPRYHIKGKGELNLLNNQINYTLGMKPLNKLDVKTPIGKTDLSQYYIPLYISGTLENPKPTLDYPGIIALTIKKQATDVIKNTVQDKVIDVFRKQLPFGN